MADRWLIKGDPGDYGYDNLESDGRTVWDGVKNNLALKHLRQFRKGDQILVYHTGDEKAIVGLARAAGDPYPDPRGGDQRLVVVEIEPVKRAKRPVTLAELKQMAEFADFPLVRMPRLSVMPVSEEHWKKLTRMAGL